MKYKSKQYAKRLSEVMVKPGVDAKKISDNFLKLLQKNGDMKKAKEIVFLAENLFIKKTGRRKVILETARRIHPKQKELVMSVASKGDIVEEKISPELLAGIKIIINSKQLDLSMQRKINNLFNL